VIPLSCKLGQTVLSVYTVSCIELNVLLSYVSSDYLTNASMHFVGYYVCCNSVSYCVASYILVTVTVIGMMVELTSGYVFSHFGGDMFRGHQMWGEDRASGDHASLTPIFAI